jgi:flagellar hook assembly protein FlgD
MQNYPNPFNPVTTIEFNVPEGMTGPVRLGIYDVTGALVRVLVDDDLPSGRYERRWDGRDRFGTGVGTGIYFYRLVGDGFSDTRKMLLLK